MVSTCLSQSGHRSKLKIRSKSLLIFLTVFVHMAKSSDVLSWFIVSSQMFDSIFNVVCCKNVHLYTLSGFASIVKDWQIVVFSLFTIVFKSNFSFFPLTFSWRTSLTNLYGLHYEWVSPKTKHLSMFDLFNIWFIELQSSEKLTLLSKINNIMHGYFLQFHFVVIRLIIHCGNVLLFLYVFRSHKLTMNWDIRINMLSEVIWV